MSLTNRCGFFSNSRTCAIAACSLSAVKITLTGVPLIVLLQRHLYPWRSRPLTGYLRFLGLGMVVCGYWVDLAVDKRESMWTKRLDKNGLFSPAWTKEIPNYGYSVTHEA